MLKLVECVPNFSEGRDKNCIDAIAQTIRSTEGVTLLDVDPGADTNRTVMTFIGSPEGVKNAAFAAIAKAAELIDMRKHHGEHPRMGATDVCPFVPVSNVSVDECVELAKELGERVARELSIPVFLYEKAATSPLRSNLADIRSGEYEGLPEKLKDPAWQPDFGKAKFNAKSGATVIGVREFLIAYNINLNTKDRKLANSIALTIREKGRAKRDEEGNIIRDENGEPLREPGKLKSCKAVGWYIDEYGQAQISMNLVDYKETPVHMAFDMVCEEAEKLGLRVTGSELVGLIPLQAMLDAGEHYLRKQGKSPGVPPEELIDIAIKSLGLKDVAAFDPREKIIEYRVAESKGPLVRMDLRDFANELSGDSPAPGGGSVSALAGALCSALASMVANLTVNKTGYEQQRDSMIDVAIRAQRLKDELLKSIDSDTDAFNRLMNAFRLPKKSEQEIEHRNEAIEEATKQAILVPLDVMKSSLDALELVKKIAEFGNKNAVSDAGVAALMGLSSVRGAGLNVEINLPPVKDESFKERVTDEMNSLIQQALALHDEILDTVKTRMHQE
ncbi:glutamate formimidoyltransferase [candidate division KSB1 bacterium]|nr:glutamate formimidoyltransferase [candidate division KSB1 bacterium]